LRSGLHLRGFHEEVSPITPERLTPGRPRIRRYMQ